MSKDPRTFRISCDCATCGKNAQHLGKSLPLVAYVTPEYAAQIKVTEATASNPRKVHATVELAHHPVMGKIQRAARPV